MKKENRFWFALPILIAMVVMMNACKQGGSAGQSFANSTGSPGEVMLVMDNQHLSAPVGEAMYEALTEVAPALNQNEPILAVSRVTEEDFTGFLRYIRNVVQVDINPEVFTHTALKYGYDQWAKGQLVVLINSPSVDSLQNYVQNNKAAIQNLIIRHELFLFGELWMKAFSADANQRVERMFGYNINVPNDILSHKEGENFLWMSNNQMRRRKDLLVYTFPYRNESDLKLDRMIEVRDSVLKANIEGSDMGSYPITERMLLKHRYIYLDKQKRGEVHGIWRMEGGQMMSGPFVMQAFVDGDKVVVVEGFIYHPNEKKRDLMRQMEAALYSMRPRSAAKFDAAVIKKARWTVLK
ncbi:DUF4837 family protein [Porphyromonas loveana]|uniref:Uncharacterized protein DUF4837 n=1 Tax=Porphyromonas loveana TaxID=1884669 RepID=A0A2U1F9I9_9PORP|nr:DUF4837 family protein [Porphyromonas loveana]PVZ08809.1 uncharacterized protein DUF4837 [Porphyromonas loveana]